MQGACVWQSSALWYRCPQLARSNVLRAVPRPPFRPHSLLCLYSLLLRGQGNFKQSRQSGQIKEKKNTKVPISLKWFINYGSKIFTQHSPQWLSHMYQHACGGAGDKTTVLILVLTPGPSFLPNNTNSKNHQKVLVTPTTGYFKPH